MKCIKVIKRQANSLRKDLIKENQINRNYKITNDDNFVYMPLSDDYNTDMINMLKDMYDFEIIDYTHDKLDYKAKSFMDYLDGVIPEDKIEDIRKSFDIIGDIVILEIPEELEEQKFDIANAVLKFTKRRSVFYKKSKIKGVMRTRDLEYLAGVNDLETIHKEYGIRFKLNPSTVYFSPRLATERERIVKQVAAGETIIDFFAGIGSFPISIAHKRNARIYSVDINPEAYKYVQENIKLNKLKGEVIPINADINEVINELPPADRIIMNLPGTAKDFLKTAVNHLNYGGVLNYYEFATDYETVIKRVEKTAYPRECELLNIRKVKSQSPGVWHIGVDIKIN